MTTDNKSEIPDPVEPVKSLGDELCGDIFYSIYTGSCWRSEEIAHDRISEFAKRIDTTVDNLNEEVDEKDKRIAKLESEAKWYREAVRLAKEHGEFISFEFTGDWSGSELSYRPNKIEDDNGGFY